jgi:hypothetical protein
MKLLHKPRRALVGMGLMATALASYPQDINFKDLARTGPPVVKSYTVDGIEAEGREYLLKFDGVDTSRVEQRNAMRSSGASTSSSSNSSSSSGSSSSSQSKSQPKSQTKVYSCKFYCKSASGPTTYRDFTANSTREAAKMAGDSAHQVCNSKGLGYASSNSFSESQCSER